MKTIKNIVVAIAFFTVLFFLVKLIPITSTTGATNYAPDGCSLTMKKKLNGIVTATKEPGLFYVTLNNDTCSYPFAFDDFKLAKDWRSFYPKAFILVGDSISKASNTDTFMVFRGNQKWMYFLPGPFTK